MWTRTHEKIYPGVTKEAVWRLWADVNNWPRWDKELEYCTLVGAFIQGNSFILKPIGAPEVKLTLSVVVSNHKFTDYCKFPGATMYDAHELTETPEGLHIKSTISVTGLLSFIWARLVAKNVANSVPQQMDALVALAKSP